MTQKEVIDSWQQGAERNLQTAVDLARLKHYDWALFIGQLALEKQLPPRIHSLPKLAELAGINLSQEQKNDFVEISRFHIQARCDDIKYEFYKKATPEYTREWLGKIKNYYQWLRTLY